MTARPRDLRSSLAGFGSQVRSKHVRLRKLPMIAEIEAMLDRPGIDWTPAFEEKRDAASRAIFGITEADTRPVEPMPDPYGKLLGGGLTFSDEQWDAYGNALEAYQNWQALMRDHDAELSQQGALVYFERLGIDVTDEDGQPLRCVRYFARQMYVASRGLLPGARLTPDGSGKRPAQSVEDWGAALAAEAARFRPSR